MEIFQKLEILADSAKYDVSCASSGSAGTSSKGKIGSTCMGGVCHTWSSDGRCISLLKILQTNICIFDCAYCVNRRSNDIRRSIFTPEEIAQLTMNFYKKNYIEGLFLSSAVVKSPDFTMELLIRTIRLLRETYRFEGYIHVKIIPGASLPLVHQAGRFADRVSVNIELPSQKSLALLAPDKSYESIATPMKEVSVKILQFQEETKKVRQPPRFSPAGQSTQLIVGATPETDLQIMKLSQRMYEAVHLKRVYYSAYVPVNQGPHLPSLQNPPLMREHRLYQADWLLRFYGFRVEELLDEREQNFDEDVDPKAGWALRHFDKFPVDVNKADYETLMRVPGIGIRAASRIVAIRKVKSVRYEDLKKLRVILKRAKYFMTINGKFLEEPVTRPEQVRQKLSPKAKSSSQETQLTLFSPSEESRETAASAITGEL